MSDDIKFQSLIAKEIGCNLHLHVALVLAALLAPGIGQCTATVHLGSRLVAS